MRPISGLYQISNSFHSDLIGSILSKFASMAEIAVVSLWGVGQLKNILVQFAFFLAKIKIKNLLELNLVGSNLFKMPPKHAYRLLL